MYEDEVEDAIGNGVNVDIDDSFGLSARIGGRFLRALAVELHYEWIDENDVDLSSGATTASGKIRLSQHTLTANAKVYLPFWRVQPYILAGVGFQRLEADAKARLGSLALRDKQSDTALAGRLGLGLEVYVTEHIAVFGEGLVVLTDERVGLPNGDEIDHIFYAGGSAGLVYRF